ncbi:hypothetical protein C2G38_2222307 [Gigaspora rosea]|uniref:Uncharacterized protein n=1 Tax=Gigaspora rosea TaxID=44941 RepID=A0A397U5X9_9GLOM|nr:hypothetical protein C2G38_2222307 [Gigaspora rosea]
MKTPSTSTPFKNSYTISISEHIRRVLGNRSLRSQMYFGPGIEAETKSEFWHGNIWQESPLFSPSSIQIDNGKAYDIFTNNGSFIKYKNKETRVGRIIAIVSTSNGTKLKIQQLYFGSELPRIFASLIRKERAKNGELWLSEITYLTNPFNVIEPFTVWPHNTPELSNYQFYVREILYTYDGRWKIRDCKLWHLHPIEYTQLPMLAPYNVPTLKIILDIYYDDFGTFRNVYHSLGGIYLQICNMPLRLRKQLKNHFVLGFVLFGGEFDDVMKPIIDEIKILEKGILMNIAGQDIWIIAALGVITADLPQGNDLADTKHHSSNQECRSCLVPKERLSDIGFDIKLNARYHHITNKKIDKLKELIQRGALQKTVNDYCTEHGLSKHQSILNHLTRNQHLQTPQDAYHAIAGKLQRLMDSSNITSYDDKIRNIKTRKRLSKNEIQKLSLPVKFDNNLQFTYDIISAYDIYMEKRAALIHRRVEFYKQISYTLLNDDGIFDTYMNLHSGDIVQIQEETYLSYAILKGIFTHQNNDGLVYSFIWVDWPQYLIQFFNAQFMKNKQLKTHGGTKSIR